MKIFFWLKIFLIAYAFVFVVFAICFADTNSTILKDSTPAYNACNGSFVQVMTGSTMTISIIFAEGALIKDNSLNGESMTIDVIFANGELIKITNSTALVQDPPAFNACDGAFIQSLVGQGMAVDIIFAEGTLNDFKMHGVGMTITISIPTVQQKITFAQGIAFEQGIDFIGHDFKWKACPNAALMGP